MSVSYAYSGRGDRQRGGGRGFLAHFLQKRSERVGGAQGATIRERGVVIASGLMAGGALGGVLGAALRIPFGEEQLAGVATPFYDNEAVSQLVSALFFIAVCVYLWKQSVRKVDHA